MKLLTFIIAVIMMSPLQAGAEDKYEKIVTLSGKEYTSVTVTKVEPDGITLMYSSGMAKIKFDDLPGEIAGKYGFDPEKADRYTTEVEARREKAQAEMSREMRKKEIEGKLEKIAIEAHGTVFQIVPDGILAKGYYYEDYKVTREKWVETGDLIVSREKQKYSTTETKKVALGATSDGLIFIECSTEGMYDEKPFSVVVFPVGTHSYSNTAGATKTLPKYTTSLKKAFRYYSGN